MTRRPPNSTLFPYTPLFRSGGGRGAVILYSALVFAAVFASGTFLLLQRDLTRVVVGIILISNSAVLFIISTGLTRGVAPIHPLEGAGSVSDPLVQAMALTALVIGFGVAALLLAMVYRLYVSHRTVDAEIGRAHV